MSLNIFLMLILKNCWKKALHFSSRSGCWHIYICKSLPYKSLCNTDCTTCNLLAMTLQKKNIHLLLNLYLTILHKYYKMTFIYFIIMKTFWACEKTRADSESVKKKNQEKSTCISDWKKTPNICRLLILFIIFFICSFVLCF